jgi:argininosuccinate lyase
MKELVKGLEIKKEQMEKKAKIGFITATELADTIVRETGIAFRTAHRIVSSLSSVLASEKEKINSDLNMSIEEIDNISLNVIGKKLSELGLTEEKVKEAMNIELNIEKRCAKGGPSRKEVDRMMEERKRGLEMDERIIKEKDEKMRRGLEELERLMGSLIRA